MNINWQEIKDKYLKAFEKFIKSLKMFVYEEHNKVVDIQKIIGRNFYENLCFCDILRFFDGYGIIIELRKISGIWYGFLENENIQNHISKIDNITTNQHDTTKGMSSREEAQDASTIKAFEILNDMIEKVEI